MVEATGVALHHARAALANDVWAPCNEMSHVQKEKQQMNAEEIANRCLGSNEPAGMQELGTLVGELALEVKRLKKKVDELVRWKEEQTHQGNGG